MTTRHSDRVPILGDLRGAIMVFEPLTVKQLGPGGAIIETRFVLQIDSLHELRLTLGSTAVVVKGRVVHSRLSEVDQDDMSYLSGVEFVELPADVHPFYVGTQAHPELKARPLAPHPLFTAFLKAASEKAGA